MKILNVLKECAWFVIELIAIVASLVLIPLLMLLFIIGGACLSIGTVMALQGYEIGHTLAYGGGIILIIALALGLVVDSLYSLLR